MLILKHALLRLAWEGHKVTFPQSPKPQRSLQLLSPHRSCFCHGAMFTSHGVSHPGPQAALLSSWAGFFLLVHKELNWITLQFEAMGLSKRENLTCFVFSYSWVKKGATSDRTAWSLATSGMMCLIVIVETGWRPWSREPRSSIRGVWHTPWLGPQITLHRKCSSEKVGASGAHLGHSTFLLS